MRVLFSMHAPTAFGAGKVVVQYADALRVAGHDVGLVYDATVESLGSTQPSIVSELEDAGVRLLHAPGLTSARTVFTPRVNEAIRAFGADMIVATQLRDAPAMSRIAERLNTPFVMLIQNPPRFQGGPVLAALKRRVYSSALARATLGVCVSGEIERELSETTDARLTTVLNAIDPGPTPVGLKRSEIRSSFGIGPDDIMIINVARIHPQKGLHILFDAVDRLPSTQPPHRLVIVGSARDEQRALEDELRRRAEEMDGVVVMAGFRTDVRDLLEASDIFVLTSVFEGGPSLAALEAMAAGLPAVLSDHGARLEGFEDGVHGDYFPVSDSSRLADLLGQYIEMDADERSKRGHRARQYVLEHRSLPSARSQFVRHIEDVGNRTRR